MPHGLGELPPGLALTASLCFPSVVCVGGAPGLTAFPAAAPQAFVGGRLVTICALPLLNSAHGKTGLSNVQGGLEPKWLRIRLGTMADFASGLVELWQILRAALWTRSRGRTGFTRSVHTQKPNYIEQQ